MSLIDPSRYYMRLEPSVNQLLREHDLTTLHRHLTQALTDQLRNWQQPADEPLLFRTHSGFDTSSVNPANTKNDELNPFLGKRGAIQIIEQPQLLNLELDVLLDLAQQRQHKISLVIPFVRTLAELHLLYNQVRHPHTSTLSYLDIWLELSVPANLLQITSLLTVPIQGLMIDIDTLHGLLHGCDPTQHELFSLYPYDGPLLESLLKPVHVAAAERELPVYWTVNTINNELINLAEKLNVDRILVETSNQLKVVGYLSSKR